MSYEAKYVQVPLRPTLGALMPAACAGWLSCICVEQLCWNAYVQKQNFAQFCFGGPNVFALCLLFAALLLSVLLFAKRWRRKKIDAGSIKADAGSVKTNARTRKAETGSTKANADNSKADTSSKKAETGGAKALLIGGACILLGVFLCAICSFLYWQNWAYNVQILSENSLSNIELETTGDVSKRDYGFVSNARIYMGAQSIAVRVLWPDGQENIPAAGHKILASGTYNAPKEDGGGTWNHMNGFAGMLYLTNAEDKGAASSLAGLMSGFRDSSYSAIEKRSGDGAALLAGIIIGNRTLYASTELEQDFKTCGLAHLMAVSGTHLAVVSALLLFFLKRCHLKRRTRSAILIAVLFFYVALTGFSPSAMRAGFMCAIALVAGGAGRRKHICTALALCVLLFLSLNPANAYSLSFLLSVLAVFGLVVIGPLIGFWLKLFVPKRFSSIAQDVGVTLSATMITMPVTIPLFAQFPLIVPFATIIAAPFITIALGLGIMSLVIIAIIAPLGALLLDFACAISGMCAFLVHFMADLPLACIPIDAQAPLLSAVLVILLILLWAFWPLPKKVDYMDSSLGEHHKSSKVSVFGEHPKNSKTPAWQKTKDKFELSQKRFSRSRIIVVFCIGFPVIALVFYGMGGTQVISSVVGINPGSSAQIVMLDVGQGDSMLLKDKDSAVLIDTGEKSDVLARALARHAITHLDAIFITHKDSDHAGALSGITGIVAVDNVYIHADLLNFDGESGVLEAARRATAGKGASGVRPENICKIGSFEIKVLGPEKGGESDNEDSLQFSISYDANGDGKPEARGFSSGDAESEEIRESVNSIGGVDFVKVPHHGSKGGFDEEELNILKPKIALISVGANNKYGHPTKQMLDLFDNAQVNVFRTDKNGDIALSFYEEKIDVAVQKSAA